MTRRASGPNREATINDLTSMLRARRQNQDDDAGREPSPLESRTPENPKLGGTEVPEPGPTEVTQSRASEPSESGTHDLPDSVSHEAREFGSTGITESETSASRETRSSDLVGTTAAAAGGVPRYLTLERKEARLRGDQVDALSALRRRLGRARRVRSEMLTDNTLIRIAIDVLLEHQELLAGDTEDELRQSLTDRLTESRSRRIRTARQS